MKKKTNDSRADEKSNRSEKENKSTSIPTREFWKAGNMLYPVPAAIVSCMDKDGNTNLITISWTGTICTDPPMVYISVRKSRYSYPMIKDTEQFVINIPTKELVKQTDFAGVRSGRDVDKWRELKLTGGKSSKVKVPYIAECPIAIECELVQVMELGTHDMFLAKVLAVGVDGKYVDGKGKFHLKNANPIVYSHGEYFELGESLGKFGFSIRKKKL